MESCDWSISLIILIQELLENKQVNNVSSTCTVSAVAWGTVKQEAAVAGLGVLVIKYDPSPLKVEMHLTYLQVACTVYINGALKLAKRLINNFIQSNQMHPHIYLTNELKMGL